METWLIDGSGNGLIDGGGLALTLLNVSPGVPTGFVMNGINAASPFDFWLYNPTTGEYRHVGGLPNEDFKSN